MWLNENFDMNEVDLPKTFEHRATKDVVDADGFMTEYHWYYDTESDTHYFYFGDPMHGYEDWEAESEETAKEWFDSYNGFEEELEEREDILESTSNGSKKITLEVKFDPYGRTTRFGFDPPRIARVSGQNLSSALTRMCDNMVLYVNSGIIDEWQEKAYYSDESLASRIIENIESWNGDGCDYIWYIKDLTNNTTIFECDYMPEDSVEDWGEDDDLEDELEESCMSLREFQYKRLNESADTLPEDSAYLHARTGDKVVYNGSCYEVNAEEGKIGYSGRVGLTSCDTGDKIVLDKEVFAREVKMYKPSAISESKMGELAYEVTEAGGLESWTAKLNKELKELEDQLNYLENDARQEVGRGGAYDSIQEIVEAENSIKEQIEGLKKKLEFSSQDK